MELLNEIKNILKDTENIDAKIDGDYLIWMDSYNQEQSIWINNIDKQGEKISWFKESDNDTHLLYIYENNKLFKWNPIRNDFTCDCHLVEWYKGFLIFVYHENHCVYICSIKDEKIRTFNFHGEEIRRKGDMFYFFNYGVPNVIRILQVPELIELQSIAIDDETPDDIKPKAIGYINYLKNKD